MLSGKSLFHLRKPWPFITVIKETVKLSVPSDKMNCIPSALKAKCLMKEKPEIDGVTREKSKGKMNEIKK